MKVFNQKINPLLFILFIFFSGLFIYQRLSPDLFPAPSGRKTSIFSWEAAGEKFSVKMALYRSFYDWYENRPSDVYIGREEESFKRVIYYAPGEQSVAELAKEISRLSRDSDNPYLGKADMATLFVQSIDYDSRRRPGGYRFPYQVLYDQKGGCADKSFLLLALLKEMGFGTAVFHFEDANHIGAGIAVPGEYSDFNSGYSYIETTADYAIGEVPEKIISGGSAQIKEVEDEKRDYTVLSNPRVYLIGSGREYKGIIKRSRLKERQRQLLGEINLAGAKIKEKAMEIEELEGRLNNLINFGDTKREERLYLSLSQRHRKKAEKIHRLQLKKRQLTIKFNNNEAKIRLRK